MVLPPDELLELENRKKKADAEREAIEAEQKLLNAQKALNDLINPDPAKAAQEKATSSANAAKSQADAEKAAAEAEKAKSEAAAAALKAKIGDIPASGISGDVTIKEDPGIMESALLYARSVKISAVKIKTAINKHINGKTVLLYALSEMPDFQALITFNAQVNLVSGAFKTADDISIKAKKQAQFDEKVEESASLAAIGLGIEAISKLAGYFKADYTYGGVTVAIDDSLLVHALSGLLTTGDTPAIVHLPAVFNCGALNNTDSPIIKEMIILEEMNRTAGRHLESHTKTSARLTEEASKLTDKAQEEKPKNAKLHKDAADAQEKARAVYTAFITKLNTPDDKNNIPLATILRESAVAELLEKGGYLLVVKIQKAGGAYYTVKNLWTAFWWGIPLYHMGGAVTSYVLIDGKNGTVVASDVIPIHGGFVRATKLQALIDNE